MGSNKYAVTAVRAGGWGGGGSRGRRGEEERYGRESE